MGAGGRDFHDFNVMFRDDPAVEVVAFTAAQIPGIDDRVYPASLAGPRYPAGIPIRPEADLEQLVRSVGVDEVVLAYSDLSHVEVMHKASRALAAGADFRLIGPNASMLQSARPVVAVCAVRTGCGKSQTSRAVGRILLRAGFHVALVRHPMPYGALERMAVQRFADQADIDAAAPSIEEREEYEAPVAEHMVVLAGVDYARVLAAAEAEADIIIWDGGNNDFPFFRPDLLITVVDPLRAGDELSYHPGELNLRMADVVVVNKVDAAEPAAVRAVLANVASVRPGATVVMAASPVALAPGPALAGARVLVVEDGPSVTHGGMPFGAGTVAAREAGATTFVDPRPYAAGAIAAAYAHYPSLGAVLPALGYTPSQLADLQRTVDACPFDVAVIGTPIDLARVVRFGRPTRRASYELAELGSPTLADALAPFISHWASTAP
ncbi:MAG TPA: GTP-binding protein [Acidimicrobiales bacterium]|nr:GTP-binding protein [Acidimicrobiales bacterium]